MTSEKNRTIQSWLLLSFHAVLITTLLVVSANRAGVGWLQAGGAGALLAVSSLAMASFRSAACPDLSVLGVVYVTGGVFFLSRFMAWDNWISVLALVAAWIASMAVPAYPPSKDDSDRIVFCAWAAPLGCAAGMLLLAIWRGVILAASAASFVCLLVARLAAGIPAGDRKVELLFLILSLNAAGGVLAGLAMNATLGIRTAIQYWPDGTLDTAGRPNYNYQSRSFDDHTGCTVAVVVVVFLAALLWVVWMGASGWFASAGVEYPGVPRLFWKIVSGFPILILNLAAVCSIPGARRKLKLDIDKNEKRKYRILLRGVYAVLLVGVAAVGTFAFMYVRRLGA